MCVCLFKTWECGSRAVMVKAVVAILQLFLTSFQVFSFIKS